MKKLLAIVLCVMMFASLSVNAFAIDSGATGGIYKDPNAANPNQTDHTYKDTYLAKQSVEALQKDIKAMYGAIAADETVFSSIQTIYDMTDSLGKELFKDVEKITFNLPGGGTKTVYSDDLAANFRKGLNNMIGDEIAKYLKDHHGSFTDSKGHFKPEKYMDTYAKALGSVLNSEKAQKNIQEIVYGAMALTTQKSVNDRADDLYKEIKDWDHYAEFGWTNPDPSVYGYAGTWESADHTFLIGTEAAYKNAGYAWDILQGNWNPNP
jgi:hypothetical protein